MRPYATARRHYAASSRWICTTANAVARTADEALGGELRGDRAKGRPMAAELADARDDALLVGVGLELDPVVAELEAERRGAAGVLAPVGLVLKHGRRALADLVAFQLGGAGHHRQEELAHRARRVDRRAPEVEQMHADPGALPGLNVRQTVRAVAEEAIELERHDPGNASPPEQVEDALTAGARLERLGSADAGVLDQLDEFEPAHRAVRHDPGALRVEADAFATLFLAADAGCSRRLFAWPPR